MKAILIDPFGHKAAMIKTTPIFGPPTTEN
jgi:hypothetical protein